MDGWVGGWTNTRVGRWIGRRVVRGKVCRSMDEWNVMWACGRDRWVDA